MRKGLSLYQVIDRAAIVLDIGCFYTKCGFAGEGEPRAIFPTTLRCYDGSPLPWHLLIDEQERELGDVRDSLEQLLHDIFFVHLNVSPNLRKVIICENFVFPRLFREMIAFLLYERFQVPFVGFLPTNILPLLPLKKKTGLVVESGFSHTTVLPVVEGYGVLSALKSTHQGDSAVHEKIFKSLEKEAKLTQFSFGIPKGNVSPSRVFGAHIQDIRLRLGFCPTLKQHLTIVKDQLREAQLLGSTHPSNWKKPSSASSSSSSSSLSSSLSTPPPTRAKPPKESTLCFPLSTECEAEFPKRIVEDCFDVLFDNSKYQSLPSLVLDSVLKADLDTRCELLQNIVLTGGVFATPGLPQRFYLELVYLMAFEETYSALSGLVFDVGVVKLSPFRASTLSWVGGAVACALKNVQCVSMEEYKAAVEEEKQEGSKENNEKEEKKEKEHEKKVEELGVMKDEIVVGEEYIEERCRAVSKLFPDFFSLDRKPVRVFECQKTF